MTGDHAMIAIVLTFFFIISREQRKQRIKMIIINEIMVIKINI